MNYEQLLNSIVSLHQRAQAGAVASVNQFLVVRNWLMGAYMIEFEQHSEGRAAYGSRLLHRLSLDLGAQQIKGCSPDMLERMRQLYLEYPQLRNSISAPLVRKLAVPLPHGKPKFSAPLSRKSPAGPSPFYFKNRVMAPGENPPVGIILCSDRRQTKVEFATAGMDNHLFVSRYLVALPKPEQLEALIEADRPQFESATCDAQASRRSKSRRRSRAARSTGKR